MRILSTHNGPNALTNAGRTAARRNGHQGREGGWIYLPGRRKPLCQGYARYAELTRSYRWDVFVQQGEVKGTYQVVSRG